MNKKQFEALVNAISNQHVVQTGYYHENEKTIYGFEPIERQYELEELAEAFGYDLKKLDLAHPLCMVDFD